MSSGSYKAPEVRRALERKGFRDTGKGKDHHVMMLFVNDSAVPIYTVVSRGGRKKVSQTILSKMYKQLNMPTKRYLTDYFDCPVDYDTYVQYLRENGSIQPEET